MQRDADILIRHLKERANNPLLATWMMEHYRKAYKLYPILQVRDVRRAEALLGFDIPSFLARVYMEIGNGGWGPGYGLLRLLGRRHRRQSSFYANSSAVRETRYFIKKIYEQEEYEYQENFLAVCDHGCTYYSAVDCRTPEGSVWAWDASGEFYGPIQATSIFEWFEGWVEGKMDGFGWISLSEESNVVLAE